MGTGNSRNQMLSFSKSKEAISSGVCKKSNQDPEGII